MVGSLVEDEKNFKNIICTEETRNIRVVGSINERRELFYVSENEQIFLPKKVMFFQNYILGRIVGLLIDKISPTKRLRFRHCCTFCLVNLL